MKTPIKNETVEKFAYDLATAIRNEDAEKYESLMESSENPINNMENWELISFRNRVHFLWGVQYD